jgi:hypothetical protein
MGEREEIEARFRANLERVQAFISEYESGVVGNPGRVTVLRADTLRAAVVFLHATLEDLLRSLAEWKLPTAPAASLDRIPLAGTGKPREKFSLVELAEFRGQTVDMVIAQSVETYLERSSYNHPGEIAELLAKIEVNYAIDGSLRNILAALMSRRHWIAHRADRNTVTGPGHQSTLSISVTLVKKWIKGVERFGKELWNHL